MNQTKNSAKSGASGNRKTVSPAGKVSATSVAAVEPKKQKLPLWVEWNENDINLEKWEVGGKVKDSKAKPASAPVSHGFEDPDPKFEWPLSIQARIDTYKRPSDIYDKTPVIVDHENGMENFDLITPNEHLHNSETIRWIISQIHSLWDMCKKDVKSSAFLASSPFLQDFDMSSNKAVAAGRLWRPWEHIYAINKVVKGPFIPAYNPYGKYAVRLYFMGTWRKIIVDDLIPCDEKGELLLPTSSIHGEIWPLLLTKALLKVISLDFNPSDSATEFNDVNVISCLTGWLPEPLPLRFGHISELWKFLKETLPKYTWPDDKSKLNSDDDQTLLGDSEMKDDTIVDKDGRSDAKSIKKGKDAKNVAGKDTKMQHKKDPKDKKGKSIIDEPIQEENFVPDFPEMVVFASFTDLPLNKLSASTEVADRRERLRKYNLNHDFSNPVWITCTRDVPLNPPPPPEKIPVWKTIRQKKKHIVPSDEPIVTIQPKPDQWIELKSPYCGYKSSTSLTVVQTNRSNSRFGKLRSRPQTAIQGIEEIDEKKLESFKSDSQTDLKTENGDLSESRSKSKNRLTADVLNKSSSSTKKENSFDGRMNGPPSISSMSKVGSTAKFEEEQGKSVKMSKTTKKPTIDSVSVNTAPNPNTLNVNSNQSLNGVDQSSNIDKVNSTENEPKLNESKNKLWMDFEDFFICFKSIIVYHKPSCFKYNEKLSDLRQLLPQHKTEKKKDTNASLQSAPLSDEKSPKLLFVDSLAPIELIVSFASMSRWYETKLDLPEKLSKILKKGDTVLEHDAMSVTETGVRDIAPLQSGSLMAEPYSWKSLITGQPVLRIHTTAIRSSFLSLPPGRHVLKFMISAPVGYHIHIVSNTKFNFGDEEDIMPKLTDESCRFIDQALHISKCLNESIKNFSDPQKQKESLDMLNTSISPLTDAFLNEGQDRKDLSTRSLYETFQNSLYEMLRKSISDQADAEMAFSWKAFMFDCTSVDLFSLKDKRPETSSTNRGSAKKIEKKSAKEGSKLEKNEKAEKQSQVQSSAGLAEKTESVPDEKVEAWKARLPTPEELISCVKIQSTWRGWCVRRIQQARTPGTNKNLQVWETLKKSWAIIEQNLHDNALFLFRTMFKLNPNIMQYYPFYKDEWNRISYVDYNGSYLEQAGNSWFILFRDVFFAHEQVLLLPKIYSNLNNCLLKVINNDNYNEIPKVFNKVSPYTYAKNKRGYTILAEARISDQPVGAGRWRLRLIGSTPALIAPRGNKPEIFSSFDIRDTRDYYIPNESKVIMRYKVNVSDDHLTTLQLTTSKPDVYIKFTIYDNGEEIMSVTGKGTAMIPAFIFMKDREINETGQTQSRPGSKTISTGRASKTVINQTDTKTKETKNKRSSSANSNEVKLEKNIGHSQSKRSSSRQSLGGEMEDDEPAKNHRYILEAVVLKNSWPLSPSQWAFVNTLKESEAADMKVFSKDRANSPSKESKSVNSESKGAVLKAAKAKAQKTKTNLPGQGSSLSRPASSAFDITKPHWSLKWVSDASSSDNIEIKKDTDRIEEIKALKRAWESHEVGRSVKAMASRTRFLKDNLVKLDGGSVTDEELEKQNEDQTDSQPSTAQAQKQVEQKSKKNDEKPSKGGKTGKKDQKVETKIESLPEVIPEPLIYDEILSNRPPTPPKAKIVLPPIEPIIEPFVRRTYYDLRIKDENFEKEQDRLRKMEFENYGSFKDQMNKFRDEERKYRLQQKIKQIEECEVLQAKLDAARKEVQDPREAFRQIFLDAERKRLEDIANQEAVLASQQKVDTKKKGSAGKGKKKK